jgi:hypothetical protein
MLLVPLQPAQAPLSSPLGLPSLPLHSLPVHTVLLGNQTIPNDYAIPIDNSDHWEDEHIHLARSPRDSLKMYRKEIAIISFLLVVGLVCLIVGLVRLFSVASGGSLILLVIGVITLIPGCYFGNEFVKSYRDGTPFRAMDF